MITIDDREAAFHPKIQNKLTSALPNGRHDIDIRRMIYSDYSFFGVYQPPIVATVAATGITNNLGIAPRIGIELQTVSNLLGKINNGELAYQVSGMIAAFDIRVLLIQGKGGLQSDRQGFIRVFGAPQTHKYDRIKDILLSAQAHGVIVDYSEDENDSAIRILAYYNYWQKLALEHTFFRPTGIRRGVTLPLGEPLDSHISYLMGAPMIGEQKALNALKAFGSLEIIHQLGEPELRSIPLWGQETSKEFLRFIRERVIKRK